MMNENTKWQFVHDVNGGWWLRLTSKEDIVRYVNVTNDRYDGALSMALNTPLEDVALEDRIKVSMNNNRDFMLLQVGRIMAQKNKTSLYKGFENLQTGFGMTLYKDIIENGETFVNPVGGKTFSLKYDQFVWRDNLVFPNYTLEDIRIKQFDGGKHYYAYVGDTQLRNGELLKWDSYDDAYNFASAVVVG